MIVFWCDNLIMLNNRLSTDGDNIIKDLWKRVDEERAFSSGLKHDVWRPVIGRSLVEFSTRSRCCVLGKDALY